MHMIKWVLKNMLLSFIAVTSCYQIRDIRFECFLYQKSFDILSHNIVI